jgi:site-specific DNA-methyltransferase (adenine-specific)
MFSTAGAPAVRVETIGDATLYLGDCREVLPTLGSVDAVVTDPPYKLSQAYSASVDADNLEAVAAIWPVAAQLREVIRPGGLAVVFYDTRILPLCLQAFRGSGWRYLRALTLYRRWGQASLVHGWMTTSDFALVFADPRAKPAFGGQPRHDVYVKDSPEAVSHGHPAQKPAEFVRHIIENVSEPGALILDPFAGSGTTAEAAVIAGRRFVGCETEPPYFDIACRRIEAAYRRSQLFEEPPRKPVQGSLLGDAA